MLIALTTCTDKATGKSEIHKGQGAAADRIPSSAWLNIWIQQGNHFQIPDYNAAKNHRTILTQIISLVWMSECLSSSLHPASQLQAGML